MLRPTPYEQALADADPWHGAPPHPLEFCTPLAYYSEPTSPRTTGQEAEQHAGEIAALAALFMQLYDVDEHTAAAAARAAYPLLAGFVPLPGTHGR